MMNLSGDFLSEENILIFKIFTKALIVSNIVKVI